MSEGFTKLFASIITSSIWSEDDKTRICWITVLALTNRDGVCKSALPGLAALARLSVEDTRKAIAKLEAPDPDSRTPDHDGRRIKRVDGGWIVLNHAKYREHQGRQVSDDPRRVYQREWMRRKRSGECQQPVSTSVNGINKDVNAVNASASASVSRNPISISGSEVSTVSQPSGLRPVDRRAAERSGNKIRVSEYSDIHNPNNDPLAVAIAVTKDADVNRTSFPRELRRVGDTAFRQALAGVWGEWKTGEIEKPGAVFTNRLKELPTKGSTT